MAKRGMNFGAILRGWQAAKDLTDEKAAAAMNSSLSVYKSWKGGRRNVGTGNHDKVLSKIGVESYVQAIRRYSPNLRDPTVVLHNKYEDSSEIILMDYFYAAQEVKETFVMRNVYRPKEYGYRNDLEAFVSKKLIENRIKILRIEQFQDINRLIDVLVNMRKYDINNYQVRFIPRSDHWFPVVNFTMFDKTAIIAGGFHHQRPLDEPYFEYIGQSYFEFYDRVWARAWDHSATELHVKNDERLEGQSLTCAQAIDETMTSARLLGMVEEREESFELYPSRY